ncbi:gas vesicle protein GvpG [Saccharopolyspora sp. NPDC000359]|uniref:gas vesicle protein GvpG n=1 Tax=Saccharopolyspora sp. NPDC000359 TaxID=3154251 RepID=UPI0033247B71
MGLISGLLTLPLAPVRGVVWTVDQVRRHAEQNYYDTAMIRRKLAEVDDAHAAGELTDEERDEIEAAWLDRLFEAQRRHAAGEL